jgi:CheY-like chemotaxis protein
VASADAALKEDLSRFAAVLSDVIMPGSMDGVALAEELRRRRPDLPIILATGFASPERLEGIGLPILRKPYRQQDLGRILASALEGQNFPE